ncbi:hypothetical protein [Sphingosinicella sp. BN140058]|uniref:hypothetical protein n=1 Tax=Sphingosinicella sp. BN140058 TaxID=1892855 RepID=UPI00101053FA|nr:hypothetical protein [Sphingosinicella sp. BN140058]QAY80314.1 hypothetical protein ETR14_27100 [Sphingosinicella sp. BN140058]
MTPSLTELTDLGLLHWQLEMGFLPSVVVTTNGLCSNVPAEAVKSVWTPNGEYILYGDFASLNENEVELSLTDKTTGAVTMQLADGTFISIEPSQPLVAKAL